MGRIVSPSFVGFSKRVDEVQLSSVLATVEQESGEPWHTPIGIELNEGGGIAFERRMASCTP